MLREAVTDVDGVVRFVDLPPGVHDLIVSRAATVRALRLEPIELPVLVEPGSAAEHVIGIRLPRREIRFDAGSSSHGTVRPGT